MGLWIGEQLIKKFLQGDICYGLREGDHVIFSLNADGVHPEGAGYGFVQHVITDHCNGFANMGSHKVGDVISHKDEEGVFFHGIVNHTIEHGWDYEYEHYSSYEAIYEGLEELYARHDDDLGARSMRSLWLGRGKMRRVGSSHGNINWNLQAMANSKADLAVYVLDGYDE